MGSLRRTFSQMLSMSRNDGQIDDGEGLKYREHKSADDENFGDDESSSKYSTMMNNKTPLYTPRLFATHPHLAVLPVLLLEFLALALTRAVLPSLLLKRYGSKTYVIMGSAECLRGLLAFFACPLFGVLSDSYGRRPCLLVTVLGTLAPVCSLAFLPAFDNSTAHSVTVTRLAEEDDIVHLDGLDTGDASEGGYTSSFWLGTMPPSFEAPAVHRIDVFVVLFALSGMFSSTFTLTFAYIADVVTDQKDRVAAFGLALATFGLSFTIGPLLGGYLANADDEGRGHGGRTVMKMLHLDDNEEINDTSTVRHTDSETAHLDINPIGQHRVFVTVLILAVVDLFYINFILPESRKSQRLPVYEDGGEETTAVAATSSTANALLPGGSGVSRRASPKFWNPIHSVKYLATHPLLRTVGKVTFLYYTALHAVVSTLVLYAARQFNLGPQQLGELMASLGLSTMVSEALLVRVAIPMFGENHCIRYGLTSFFLQVGAGVDFELLSNSPTCECRKVRGFGY